MKIVVDTNIIFSSLLYANSYHRNVITDDKHTFYSPNFVFIEIFKHKEKIIKCSHVSEEYLYEYLNKILENIHFVNPAIISIENKKRAYQLCSGIDEKDTPFVALTYELNALLWTGDKKLIKGLTVKGFTNFFDYTKK